MPTNFTRPTIAALIARVQTDIESEISGVTARLRRRFEFGLAKAIAGVAHHLHGHLAWVAEQIIVDQASERFVLRWADFYGVARKPATQAKGKITVVSNGSVLLPAGTEWVRLADGARYTTDVDRDIAPDYDVEITAVDAGSASDLAENQILQISTPIAGINSSATVTADDLVAGVDVESVEALRERTLERIQNPPRGGAPGDHITWAKEYPGVDRAWEFPRMDENGADQPGTVSIAFVTTVEADGVADDNGLPSAPLMSSVLSYVQGLSPAKVKLIELQASPLTLSIKLEPMSAAAAVKTEIEDFINRTREPGGTIYLSQLSEAISRAAGEQRHEIVSPASDVTCDFGEISTYALPTINPFP